MKNNLTSSRTSARFSWKTLALASALLAGTASTVSAGFSIQSGTLLDNNGNAFIMRGINYPHRWFPQNTSSSIPAIAATGANCVRLVLGNGRQWEANSQADVASLIQLCKTNRLIAIPEVHDCTGFGDSGSAAPLSTAVDYWISIQGALTGQENFVIINIANEPFGNNASGSWASQHITAIQRLRTAGFTHTLMVDAANWGQDWSGTTRAAAAQVFNADPLRNVIFSVHMYEVYTQDSVINAYMQAFDTANLPLLVGEFAASHQPGQDVNEAAILQRAQQYGMGYIGWSWSGNSSPSLTALDIVTNFNPSQRSTWGNRLITGANGISTTSQICTVFNTTTTPTLTVSPTTLSFTAAAGSSPVAVTSNTGWSVTDNQTWITVSPTSGSNNGSVSVSVTANTGTTARTGTVTFTATGVPARTVSVTQAGAGGGNTLNVSTTALSFTAAAGSNTFGITSNVGWTVTDNQTWITTSPTSGSNNATVTVTVTANTGTAARSGTITVAGVAGSGVTPQTITVTQAAPSGGTPCANPITVTVPFTKDGAGDFCYVTSGTINYINSWNMQGGMLEVNGVNVSGLWVSGANLPPRINGNYYFRYVGPFPWSHFEIR